MEHKGYLQEFALRILEEQCPEALRMALNLHPLSSTPGELPTSTAQLQAWEERMDLALECAAKLQCCP